MESKTETADMNQPNHRDEHNGHQPEKSATSLARHKHSKASTQTHLPQTTTPMATQHHPPQPPPSSPPNQTREANKRIQTQQQNRTMAVNMPKHREKEGGASNRRPWGCRRGDSIEIGRQWRAERDHA